MSRLHELRRILFEEERQSLDELRSRIADAEARAADVAEILPAAVRASDAGDDLVESLRAPVGRVIRDSVRNDPDSFANALFPVIGPAIRKAVTESIRALADRINKTVEQSLSWNMLKWRFEAARSGVPLADIIVRETLLYDTEELFVIERDSGLLLAHLDKDDTSSPRDSDAVSAMLTAIQDFVRDSFAGGEHSELDAVEIGGRSVWISYGPGAMLAAVFTGNPPVALRSEFHAANETIHRRYASAIEQFNGDRTTLDGIDSVLRPLLKTAMITREGAPQVSYKPLIITAALLGLALVAWIAYAAMERGKIDRFIASLGTIPGVIVIDQSERGGATHVRLLQDPLSVVPAGLAGEYGLDDADVVLETQPFLSTHRDIVLDRIRQQLEPPPTVSLTWRDNVVVASGDATKSWLARARAMPVGWSGAAGLDVSGVQSAEARLLADLRVLLDVPESVELALSGNTVRASGIAPVDWLLGIDEAEGTRSLGVALDLAAVRVDLGSLAAHLRARAGEGDAFAFDLDEETLGIYGTATLSTRDYLASVVERFDLERKVDISRLMFIDLRGFRELLDRYRGFTMIFTGGTTLTTESADALRAALPDLARLATLGAATGTPFVIRITGYTDGSGRPALNERLRERRAQYIAERLIGAGVESEIIAVSAGATPAAEVDERTWRRATITFD